MRRDDHLLINMKKSAPDDARYGHLHHLSQTHLSKQFHTQYVRPYLLRNLAIDHPDRVSGVDISSVRMRKGFMYLFIIIDGYSRCIVDFELPSTLDKAFVLESYEVKISMDGKGQALDNVRTERFFPTLKYDCVYINEFNSPRELRIAINQYIHEDNTYLPHSSLGGQCPSQVYDGRQRQVA